MHRPFVRTVLLVAVLAAVSLGSGGCSSPAPDTPSAPTGPRPDTEAGLRWYLSRAVTFSGLLTAQVDEAASAAFIRETGARFLGRTIHTWGYESLLRWTLPEAASRAARLHALFPDLILQGCLFEAVSRDVEKVEVPAWALSALGLPAGPRNFDYDAMLFPAGETVGFNQWSEFPPTGHWGPDCSIPDIRKAETQLWYYYLARTYLDLGCESIHLGQIHFMAYRDTGHTGYTRLLGLLRAYAKDAARRGFVLFDGPPHNIGILGSDGRLLLDFGATFTALTEKPPYPGAEIVPSEAMGSLYGKSPGGTTPMGWPCAHLPYLVELDNWGADAVLGVETKDKPSVYGYDEITWFSNLGKAARDNWLRYQAARVKALDPSAHFQYPAVRGLTGNTGGAVLYQAFRPGPGTPDGFDQVDVIRELLALHAVP